MKEKVLKLLKPLLADKGFTKEELEGLSEIAAKNLTEASTEEDINNVVNGIVPYADMMQRVGNRYATLTEKKYEGWTPKKPKETKTDETDKTDVLSAEEIQKLISNGIADAIKPYKEREEQSRLRTLLYSNEKVKDIPDVFRGKYKLEKEEDLDSLATLIEKDYSDLKKTLVDSGEFATPPATGTEGDSDDLINALKAMGDRGAN